MQLALINSIIISILVCLFASCEKQTEWNIANSTTPSIVVESIITNDLEHYTVKLSLPISGNNETPQPISNAKVSITGNNEITLFEDSEIKGTYTTKIKQRAVIRREYTLKIEYQNKTYTASAQMIPITKFSKLSTYKQGDLYSIVDNFASTENAMWEILYDWDFSGSCDTCRAKQFFYAINSVDIAQIFPPKKQRILFPLGTTIIAKKYSLSKPHAAYIRQFLLETNWNGNYFDQNPAPIVGNISENGLGYFGACSVLYDTLVVK